MQAAEARGINVRQCMRTMSYDLERWGPPGLSSHVAPGETTTLGKKKLADVIEALIGIVFEVGGMHGAVAWMQHFGVLPAAEHDPRPSTV